MLDGSDNVKILGIAGSLRRGSYNRMTLRAATEIAGGRAGFETFDLSHIPPYNADIEYQPPAPVIELKDAVRRSDAVLFVTPEYNYSISGVLKNAIDFASRPYGDNVWKGKPAGIMSASTGLLGGARAQYHLRQAMVFLDMRIMNIPEVFVMKADEKFDHTGKLTDETTRAKIASYVDAYLRFVEQALATERDTEREMAGVR